jgi:drug/metabolite transporter (DMT)-like permease
VLLATLFLDEPLTWPLILGALLVIGGVILLSMSGSQASGGRAIEPAARRKGLLLALLTSVLWGAGQVALKPATAGMHSVVANSVRQPLGLLMLLGLNLAGGRWRDLARLDRKSWGVILVASLVGTGLGTLFFVMAIQMIGSGRTAVLTSTTPLMAIPFSLLWLQERPTRWTLGGTLLTTAGIALVV